MTFRQSCQSCHAPSLPVGRHDEVIECGECGARHDIGWVVNVDHDGVSGHPVVTLLEDDEEEDDG